MSENKESWFYKLIPFGFAPGSYERKCAKCERAFLGDKRATGCVSCATITQQAKEIVELKARELELLASIEVTTTAFPPSGGWDKSPGIKNLYESLAANPSLQRYKAEQAAHDLIKRNEVIEEVLRFVDDGTDWVDNSEVFAAIRNLKTTQD